MNQVSSTLTQFLMHCMKFNHLSCVLPQISPISTHNMVGLEIFGDLSLLILMVCAFHLIFLNNTFFVAHLLPLALGHHSGNESKETWSWFLDQMQEKFAIMKEDIIILIDRDKGGREAIR